MSDSWRNWKHSTRTNRSRRPTPPSICRPPDGSAAASSFPRSRQCRMATPPTSTRSRRRSASARHSGEHDRSDRTRPRGVFGCSRSNARRHSSVTQLEHPFVAVFARRRWPRFARPSVGVARFARLVRSRRDASRLTTRRTTPLTHFVRSAQRIDATLRVGRRSVRSHSALRARLATGGMPPPRVWGIHISVPPGVCILWAVERGSVVPLFMSKSGALWVPPPRFSTGYPQACCGWMVAVALLADTRFEVTFLTLLPLFVDRGSTQVSLFTARTLQGVYAHGCPVSHDMRVLSSCVEECSTPFVNCNEVSRRAGRTPEHQPTSASRAHPPRRLESIKAVPAAHNHEEVHDQMRRELLP